MAATKPAGNSSARVAVLDLGTNTFHLLIADIGECIQLVHAATLPVRLGESGINRGLISPEAFDRGLNVLKEFRRKMDSFQVGRVECVATSAIRDASNGLDFIAAAKATSGIEPKAINGDQEAILIYQGVRAALPLEQVSLIMDIGGGSVELILCDASTIFWKKSYPIGAARLMDEFHRSDPLSEKDIQRLHDYLDSTLYELKEQISVFAPKLLIGSAGAFETLAAFQEPEFKTSFLEPTFNFSYDRLQNIIHTILKSNHEQRTQMPEIIPVRVDMIVVAAALTRYILSLSGIKTIKLSTYSLKEGILFGMLK
jgi:exopolyphosphatase/guanosine-5'-triphosphate,3'-diphosphate pyrophosphatase